LVYTHTLTLEDAIKAEPLQLKTLDGRPLSIQVNGLITPQTEHKVKGEGMPVYVKGDKSELLLSVAQKQKGDLIVKFLVVFPQNLSHAQKERAIEILSA